MDHINEELARQLRTARQRKGLSQRELSALTGVPQSHISRIEAGQVNLRFTSLIAIARALDLEPTLVPRRALPTIKSIIRSLTPPTAVNPAVQREFKRLADAFEAASTTVPSLDLWESQQRLRELQHYLPHIIEPDTLKKLRRAFTAARTSGSAKAVENAAQRLQALTNQLARNTSARDRVETPRPAYDLQYEED